MRSDRLKTDEASLANTYSTLLTALLLSWEAGLVSDIDMALPLGELLPARSDDVDYSVVEKQKSQDKSPAKHLPSCCMHVIS